jgi:hypothetical protein
MQSKAATVKDYLASLPEDRRRAIDAVRAVIRKNLDKDYEEGMQYGMIGYYIPHRVFPPGYHCDPKQPLPFAGLASQKNYMSVYLMSVYGGDETWFRARWEQSGKKLDMGKCCVRFKTLDALALDVIGEAVKRMPAKSYIEQYQANLDSRKSAGGSGGSNAKPAKSAKPQKKMAKKAAKKKSTAKKTVARKR